jgi:hypothetical protein
MLAHDEFIRRLEKAILNDDRWQVSLLEKDSTDNKLRKEVCRYADNFIIFDSNSNDMSEMARLQLHSSLNRLMASEKNA